MPKTMKHIPIVSYRNAIYQGGFDFRQEYKHGFGILYLTTKHQFIASHWKDNKLNGHTLAFIGSTKYIYGIWQDGKPHGIVYARFGDSVVISQYDQGSLREKIIVISEKYNVAAVVQLCIDSYNLVHSEIISKGQLFTKQHLDQFLLQCKWDHYSYSYETLVKYLSQNMLTPGVRIQLINDCFYRYGFQKTGLAVVFDDDYRIRTVGMHHKNELKGIGFRNLDQHIAQQGNWESRSEVIAYDNKSNKPQGIISRIYNNLHLKAINFQNQYLVNQAQGYFQNIENLIKGQLLKQIIAGTIYTSRRSSKFSSVESEVNQKLQKSKEEITLERLTLEQRQRRNLQIIKDQIYDSVRKKKIHQQIELSKVSNFDVGKESYVKMEPVGTIVNRNTPSRDARSRLRSRSPIFQNRSQVRSPSPSNLSHSHPRQQISPFAQRMKERQEEEIPIILKAYNTPIVPELTNTQKNVLQNSIRPKRHKSIFQQGSRKAIQPQITITQPIEETKSRKSIQRKINLRQFDSPFHHVNISQGSKVQQRQSRIQAMPISMQTNTIGPKLQEDARKSSEVGPKAHFGKNQAAIPLAKDFFNKESHQPLIKQEKEQTVRYSGGINQYEKKDIRQKSQTVATINPYEIRDLRQQIQKKMEQLQQKQKTFSNKSYSHLTKKPQSKSRDKQQGTPFFPVRNNSAYLKQRQIPVSGSSPSHIPSKRSPYKYFQNNPVFSTKPDNKKNTSSTKSRQSNKPYYEPINVNSPSRAKESTSQTRSQNKKRNLQYYQEEFRKRIQSSRQSEYANKQQQQAWPQNKITAKRDHGNGKVIQESVSRGGYNYYFQ